HAKQDLGIRSIDQIRPFVRERGCQRGIAVDLPVEDERVTGARIDTRLPAALRIDDREPQVPECDLLVDMDAALVRPAMADRGEHAAQERCVGLRGAPGIAGEADDAAHLATPPAQSVLTVSRTT